MNTESIRAIVFGTLLAGATYAAWYAGRTPVEVPYNCASEALAIEQSVAAVSYCINTYGCVVQYKEYHAITSAMGKYASSCVAK